MSRQRVFVSSVIDGFEAFRDAARRGVEAAGADPVMVEDFPSLATSPRNACLDGIENCDYLASIVGERGGWTAPSGHLVVEEEFEYARRRNRPVLAFIQDVSRDRSAEKFVRVLSDYVSGGFRTTFRTPAELQRQVERAVGERIGTMIPRTSQERDLSSYFQESRRDYSLLTILRSVFIPERDEEVVDPVRISSSELQQQIYELGHASNVGFFSYAHAKTGSVEGSNLVIEQVPTGGRHGEGEYARLVLSEAGAIVVDANVTGRVRRGNRTDLLDSMVVATEDVEAVLAGSFRFAEALYRALDPFERHERVHYNVGIRGLGHRMLERNPQARSAMTMSMRGDSDLVAYDRSRIVSRATLREPRAEIERIVTVLQRKANE